MKIGTYYYPEQWPREQWVRDFDRIAAMGLTIVHMAEFAWYALEPRPGEFRFDWLDESLTLAQQRKMDVILCTPTAAPPIWLAHEFPDSLSVDRHGAAQRFGGRRHYSPVSPAMHDATRRIVAAMAEHFGGHPSVIGWQIDNEYGGGFDQSPAAHEAFRVWLRRKYQTIDRLNQAWGCQFWNTYYTDFSQVMFPQERQLHYDNPHHRLDASRFWSHAWAGFNKIQTDILKPKIGDRFLTTNFMPLHPDADPADMAGDLTMHSWDSYPVTGWGRAMKDENYRLADPSPIELMHEHMRSFSGRWSLLEIQPGQTNWSGVPVLLYPGAVRLWLWTAIMHGCELLTVYRFRQPRFGTELFHHGLIQWDGMTLSEGGREFEQVVDELAQLKLDDAAVDAAPAAQPTVGILLDFEQLWYFTTLPQAKRWNQNDHLARWFGAAAGLGLDVCVIRPDQDWPASLKLVIAPGVQMVDDALVAKMKSFTEGGGHLLLTCRTGLFDRTGQAWEGPIAAPLADLIGATIEAYDSLPEDTFGHVELDDAHYPWTVWGDLLYPGEGTRTLAKYADQFYAGAAAITQHTVGSGTVTYCGVFAENALAEALVERVARQVRLATIALPGRVRLGRRGPYRVAVNFNDNPVDLPELPGARFVLGSRTLPAAGVAVWIEQSVAAVHEESPRKRRGLLRRLKP